MPKTLDEMSAFAQAALVLDEDFALMKRLGDELERADLDTEFGLNQSKKLLARYSECGQRIGDEIQTLAKALDEARTEAENYANRVMERALEVQKRSEEKDQLLSRFQSLGEKAKELNEITARYVGEDKASVRERLPEIQARIDSLSAEALTIKQEAQQSKMKAIEKDAEAFRQMLGSVSTRLRNALH